MTNQTYIVTIESKDGHEVDDYMNTKKELVNFVNEETGIAKYKLNGIINAKMEDSYKFDTKGFRVFVYYQ